MTQGESYATVSRFVLLSVWENLIYYKGQLCPQFIKAQKGIFTIWNKISQPLLTWLCWEELFDWIMLLRNESVVP